MAMSDAEFYARYWHMYGAGYAIGAAIGVVVVGMIFMWLRFRLRPTETKDETDG